MNTNNAQTQFDMGGVEIDFAAIAEDHRSIGELPTLKRELEEALGRKMAKYEQKHLTSVLIVQHQMYHTSM